MIRSILSVAYPFAPVRSDCSGGAEQILLTIDSKLTELGYNCSVLAVENSKVSGRLIPIPVIESCITDKLKNQIYKIVKNAIEKELVENRPELIHFHGLDFYNYIPYSFVPCLVTLHLPIEFYPVDILNKVRNIHLFNFVSKTQKRTAPLSMGSCPVIQNGINIIETKYLNTSVNKFLLCIGRICPEKGFDIGLRIAKKLKISLLIAGRVFPYESHISYFREKIIPELDGVDYKFLGELDIDEKRKVMRNAKCVLITSQIDETSSLVAMESLSCGTPVVAFNRGALPSIVEDGKTGYVCKNEDEMINGILNIDKIDRRYCFEVAKKSFSSDKMVKKYVDLYNKLIKIESSGTNLDNDKYFN
jgi:glycosyltransferase involved in cell wall biosynthesis